MNVGIHMYEHDDLWAFKKDLSYNIQSGGYVCVYIIVGVGTYSRIFRHTNQYTCTLKGPQLHHSKWRVCTRRGGGLGSRPKKMYGKRLGDGVEYHLMSPTPRR